MRVEVRRRADASPTGESPAAGQFEIPKHGLSEAYSDDCFESPTRFFIASPEHPKLGKWAQPSTLKYQAPHAHQPSTQCLDEAVLFASTHNKVRPVSSSSLKGRRQNARGSSATSNRLGCGSARIRQKMEPSRAKRSVSPVSPLRAGSESPPSSSIRGRREEPRIDTPVSGRVSSLASTRRVSSNVDRPTRNYDGKSMSTDERGCACLASFDLASSRETEQKTGKATNTDLRLAAVALLDGWTCRELFYLFVHKWPGCHGRVPPLRRGPLPQAKPFAIRDRRLHVVIRKCVKCRVRIKHLYHACIELECCTPNGHPWSPRLPHCTSAACRPSTSRPRRYSAARSTSAHHERHLPVLTERRPHRWDTSQTKGEDTPPLRSPAKRPTCSCRM